MIARFELPHNSISLTDPHSRQDPFPAATAPPLLRPRKRVPKSERLVPGTRDDSLPVGAHGEVQDAVRVSRKRGNHVHPRVGPDTYLVLPRGAAVPMR